MVSPLFGPVYATHTSREQAGGSIAEAGSPLAAGPVDLARGGRFCFALLRIYFGFSLPPVRLPESPVGRYSFVRNDLAQMPDDVSIRRLFHCVGDQGLARQRESEAFAATVGRTTERRRCTRTLTIRVQ